MKLSDNKIWNAKEEKEAGQRYLKDLNSDPNRGKVFLGEKSLKAFEEDVRDNQRYGSKDIDAPEYPIA